MSDAAAPQDALLQVRGVCMEFRLNDTLVRRARRQPLEALRAVDGVDLEIRRGEALGLVGESGCGKSTLGRCIVGLYEPTGGDIVYDGNTLPPARARSDRRRMQMVFQDPYSSLNPRMTVAQTLGELLRVHKMVPRNGVQDRCRELLELVGLSQQALHAYPRQFSGGQRQRVSIARALALEPELLIADEPVSALDVSVQATVLNLLDDLRHRLGLTMLFIAHNMAVVRHVCDRVAVMYLGRIVETAPTHELFTNPRHPYTKGLLKAVPRLAPGRVSTAEAVVGDPPSPINLPSGCRFHPRCPLAQDVCHTDDPKLTSSPESAGLHSAACHFAWTAVPAAHVPEVAAEETAG
jgi:oligopeptide transport system ATP-binding protein